jgi:hypothetical protein
MNPVLFSTIVDGRRTSPGCGSSADDGISLRAVLPVALIILSVLGWSIYQRMQWETIATSNVWLRVAAADDNYRFTPLLVDDITGDRFSEQIGGKHCYGGPGNLPLGQEVLAAVETQVHRKDGRRRYILDAADLGRRYC